MADMVADREVDKVANMVADMEKDKIADMEVDKVADKVTNMEGDIMADMMSNLVANMVANIEVDMMVNMQPVWLCIITCRSFEDTHENTHWRKVKQTGNLKIHMKRHNRNFFD